MKELTIAAPAKINLFLHVVGQREDGYHLLQSVFEPIDLADSISISVSQDGAITRTGDLLGPPSEDLGLRAAQALSKTPQWQKAGSPGAVIHIEKKIPSGAGLGGGSSDAAAVLLALNRLWGLGLSPEGLAEMGLGLGADVPFFLQGRPAFVEGIGEKITPLSAPKSRWLVLAVPRQNVATALIFKAPELTRNSKPLKIADFAQAAVQPVWEFGRNDLEPVTCARFPDVARVLSMMKTAAEGEKVAPGAVRMSGSGGSVFCTTPDEKTAQAVMDRMSGLQKSSSEQCIALLRVCKTLTERPGQS